MTVEEALRKVGAIPLNGWSTDYASMYARKALELGPNSFKDQVPYVLSNLQWWRAKEAKVIRSTLKVFLKGSK